MLLREHEKDEDAGLAMRGELTDLYLNACGIGDDQAIIVAEFLKLDERVLAVHLRDCRIGQRGVEAIAEALRLNDKVEYLSLVDNELGDEGAEIIIDALSHNVCVKKIFIWANGIASKTETAIEYLTFTRNAVLIPAAVRCASLFLIAARSNIADARSLSIFPKEIVRMIAMKVWATRKDSAWIEALSEPERTGKEEADLSK